MFAFVKGLIDPRPRPPPPRPRFLPPPQVMFIGTGEGKASLLPQLLDIADGVLRSAGAASPYPAARVKVSDGRKLLWCVDEAAAAQCSPEIKANAEKC